MSKKYKAKTCTYCDVAGISATGDHVFAREFFPITKRAGLPQVPACERCNNKKAHLEHYLTAVMPFGGQHADAHFVLNEMVEPRLAKNSKLRQALTVGWETVSENVGGVLVHSARIPFQTEKLEALCAMIAKGLAFHHFGVVIPTHSNVRSGVLTSRGEEIFGELLAMNGNRILESVGDGAFEYEGVQSRQDVHLTIWRIKLYGGLRLGGDPKAPNENPFQVWVTTSKSRAIADLLELEPA